MIPVDKQLHLAGGALITLLVGVHTGDWHLGFYAGVAAGAAKEVLDEITYGGADWKDFAFTVLGAAFGSVTAALI